MTVIAMTREMGTLGREVAAGLSERLNINVVHHELVEHDIAERAGMRESEVHRFLEGEAKLMERWRIDAKRMSRYTAHEILELAAKGNVLIRGWGATYLLRDVPHIVCVRICAPLQFRARVLMKRLAIADTNAASREIQANDAAHHGVMHRMFGVDWKDPTLYCATLNTARVPVEDCITHIAELAGSDAFKETEISRGILTDRLIAARVRLTLDKHYNANLPTIGIDIQVKDGVVSLYGASSDEHLIADIVRRTHSAAGVKRVESHIEHIAFARRGWT